MGDVLPGAAATAVLFNVGKFVIGWYIGTPVSRIHLRRGRLHRGLLVWVHYSAQIVLFGAQVTHAHAAEGGSRRTESADASAPHKASI